jgi:hypothetical protein
MKSGTRIAVGRVDFAVGNNIPVLLQYMVQIFLFNCLNFAQPQNFSHVSEEDS